ncbi:MAG TPA: lipoprotein [Steroidobacteraceae bacterium]|jgi:predicted small lipoprotein YifL|nr:lipoprotein [Steroidobacteraceae bacterium]
MRFLSILALTAAAAGCGQTGALYLPDKGVETPVEIRAPGTPPPASEQAPTTEPEKEKKDDKATQPPGR